MITHTRHLPTIKHTPIAVATLFIGGVLWILDFVTIWTHGNLTGSLPGSVIADLPLYSQLGLRLFSLSIPILLIGLATLTRHTLLKQRMLTLLAAVFIVIPLVLSSINIVTLFGPAGTFNDTFMGLSVFSTSIATGLIGLAARRSKTLARPAAWSLIAIGVMTIPVLFGTPLPIGPDWATDHLAFLLSGSLYVLASVTLHRERA